MLSGLNSGIFSDCQFLVFRTVAQEESVFSLNQQFLTARCRGISSKTQQKERLFETHDGQLHLGMDQYLNTIFRGMNIHLPAILMWTTGVPGFWHTATSQNLSTPGTVGHTASTARCRWTNLDPLEPTQWMASEMKTPLLPVTWWKDIYFICLVVWNMNGLFSISYMGYKYMILPIDELHHFPRWLKQKKPVMDLVSLSETGVYHLVIFMSFFPYFGAYVCNGDWGHHTIPSFNPKGHHDIWRQSRIHWLWLYTLW